jgi:predicted S18 family serine protease
VITQAVVDEPAPFFWDDEAARPAGGEAARFELEDPSQAPDLSAWYHLSYIPGGQRLRVYEHSPRTSLGLDSAIAKSERVAWRVAIDLLGPPVGGGDIPTWARPRTGNTDGPSAGLLFALASLDVLTAGPLAASLRVAGTGAIGSDGVITAVRMIDAKLAAARLASVDVFFAPEVSADRAAAPHVVSHLGRPAAERAIGDWLNTAAYERAGRAATLHPGTLAVVEVDDIRQALAWLCGRTERAETCAIAHDAAAVPLRAARPYVAPAMPVRASATSLVFR